MGHFPWQTVSHNQRVHCSHVSSTWESRWRSQHPNFVKRNWRTSGETWCTVIYWFNPWIRVCIYIYDMSMFDLIHTGFIFWFLSLQVRSDSQCLLLHVHWKPGSDRHGLLKADPAPFRHIYHIQILRWLHHRFLHHHPTFLLILLLLLLLLLCTVMCSC